MPCDYGSSRFYFILYEVDSPLKLRFGRYAAKYKAKTTLEDFVELDDKIRFNTEEFQLYQTDPEH